LRRLRGHAIEGRTLNFERRTLNIEPIPTHPVPIEAAITSEKHGNRERGKEPVSEAVE
jgi:hypothetical protein